MNKLKEHKVVGKASDFKPGDYFVDNYGQGWLCRGATNDAYWEQMSDSYELTQTIKYSDYLDKDKKYKIIKLQDRLPKTREIWKYGSNDDRRFLITSDGKSVGNSIQFGIKDLPHGDNIQPKYSCTNDNTQWELVEGLPEPESVFTLKPDGTWGKMEL